MSSSLRTIPLPDGHVDLLAGEVHRAGSTVRLSSTEIAVLTVLTAHAPGTVTEELLLRQAWGYRATNTRTVSVTMSRIRTKLEVDPRSPQVVLTVRGEGYRFVPTPSGSVSQPERSAPELPGRSAEIETIRAALKQGHVELIGPGGIGKSALALAAVRQGRWVELFGVQTGAGLVRRIAQALGLEGEAVGERVGLALRSGEPVVLDGAGDLDGHARGVLQELVSGAPGVLVTSRAPVLPGATRVLVGPLDDAASLAVVNRSRAQAGLSRLGALPPTLEALGGHPLALVVAAPLAELLPAPSSVLAFPVPGDQRGASVERVLRQSLDRLDADARELLTVVATFAAPPEVARVTERTGLPLPTLLLTLHDLRTLGLLTLDQGVVAVHAFVRLLVDDAEVRGAHVRWLRSIPTEPFRLLQVRHELEFALRVASGDTLADVLLRHILVLHTFGPTDQLLQDVNEGVARLGVHPVALLLRGAALVAVHESEAGCAELRRGLAALGASPDWEAWAWLYLEIGAVEQADSALQQAAIANLERLRSASTDETLFCLLTLRVAAYRSALQQAGADALYREVESRLDTQPVSALIATISRLLSGTPTPPDLQDLERRLRAVGEDAMGMASWQRRWLEVAHLHFRVGNPQAAWALLEQWAAPSVAMDASQRARLLGICAAYVANQPERLVRLLEWIPETQGAHARVRWLLQAPDGAPPFDDPGLRELLTAWRDGAPIPEVPAWSHLVRGLRSSPRC